MKKLALTTLICAFLPTHSWATEFYKGKDYTIAGPGASGLCRLLNERKPCERHEENWAATQWNKIKCHLSKKDCDSTNSALTSASSGKADLAIVPSTEVTSESNIKVLFYTRTDKERLLVTRPDMSTEKAKSAVEQIVSFFSKETESSFITSMINMPELQTVKNLNAFIEFESAFPLHQGMAEVYLDKLAGPLRITYGWTECDRKKQRRECISISDVPYEDYSESQNIAKMGMSVTPFLIQSLSSDNPFLVSKSAYALGDIWPHDAKQLTPPLIALLQHPNAEVREQAIVALGKLEPIQPETLDALEEQVKMHPQARESFSDGSINMSQTITHMGQLPVATTAAITLSSLDHERALRLFQSHIADKDEAIQASTIRALDRMLRMSEREAFASRPKDNTGPIKRFQLPAYAQQAFDLLKAHQSSVSEANAKEIVNIMGRYELQQADQRTIESLAKDLVEAKPQCGPERPDMDRCNYPTMREALYKLQTAGEGANIPAVYKGIDYAISKGAYVERENAYELIGILSQYKNFPADFGQKILEIQPQKQENALIKSWQAIGQNQPNLSKSAINHLKQTAKNDPEVFNRVGALSGLAVLVPTDENADKLVGDIFDIIRSEKHPQAIAYMLPPLAKMGNWSHKAVPLLIRYLSFGIEELNLEAIGLKSESPENLYNINVSGTNVPDYMYGIRSNAAEAISELEFSSPEIIAALEKNYKTGTQPRETIRDNKPAYSCGFSSYHRQGLLFMIWAHKKYTQSQANLVPPTIKLLSYKDQYCTQDALLFIQEIGKDAAIALPQIEATLNQTDLRQNYAAFEALEKIGTPEALALAQKHSALNPKTTENSQPPLYDLIDSLNRYFSFVPELEKAELHIITVEETPTNAEGNKTGEVKVVVDYPKAPVLLSLNGKLPIRWSLDIRNGSKVIGVWFRGNEVQVAGDIPSDIPVGGFVNNPRYFEYQLNIGEYLIKEQIERTVGKNASTVQYILNTDNVVLNSETKPLPFPPGQRLDEIFNR